MRDKYKESTDVIKDIDDKKWSKGRASTDFVN